MPALKPAAIERGKKTRLEDLDVKAKTILQAWHSARVVGSGNTTGYGTKHQQDLGSFVSNDDYQWTDSYYRDSDYAYKPGPGRGSAESVNHQSEYLENNKNPELFRKIGSVLYWSQHGSQWHGGPIPPDRVSDYNPTKPFAKFSNKNHKRPSAKEDRDAAMEAFGSGGWKSFYAKADEISARNAKQVGPPTLEERWDNDLIPGGRYSETTGSSPSMDMPKRFAMPRRYEGETKGQIDVSVGDATLTVPDSPQNRDIYERFLHTKTTKRPDDDGLGMFDYFFMLVDEGGGDQYGRKTIRSAWDKLFADEPMGSGAKKISNTEDSAVQFSDTQSYDHNFKFPAWYSQATNDTNVLPVAHSWPRVNSTMGGEKDLGANADRFGSVRLPKNLEELWNKLLEIQTNGPYSPQVQRSGQTIRLSDHYGPNRLSTVDYKVRFLGALNGTFANVPDKNAVKSQGEAGFNVGQVAPYGDGDPGDTHYVFGDKREMDFPMHHSLWASFQRINTYEQQLMDLRPGGNRINVVFNIRLNLSRLLQQNLLMPSDIHPIDLPDQAEATEEDLATAIEAGRSSIIEDNTFTKLYLQNRSALHSKNRPDPEMRRSPPGTIGGRAVASLQGAVSYRDSSNEWNFSDEDDKYPVFRFEEEDGPTGRNNIITQDRGFIDNIAGNVHENKGIAGLLPAVENDPTTDDRADQTTLVKTLGRADEQFFPFMFETVNKKGTTRVGLPEHKQYAYFQATLQSLSESYAPAWSSKHFFGRTEQIHTYTMTERTLDITFVIVATEIRRLQNVYERVNWLAQQTYASYDSSNRLKAGPIIRMTIGDMFSNLSGFIRSLSFDWNYLGPGGKWEISQGLRIPMACSVTMNFTVMHDDMPDRNYNLYPGPMLHPLGVRGDRGKTAIFPEGGPMIATEDRFQGMSQDTITEKSASLLRRAESEDPVVKAAANEEISAYGGMEQVKRDGGRPRYLTERRAQYIDVLDYNTSKGTRRVDSEGVVHVGDTADQIY